MPAGNTSIIAETTATPLLPLLILILHVCEKRFTEHYNGDTALINQRYRGATTAPSQRRCYSREARGSPRSLAKRTSSRQMTHGTTLTRIHPTAHTCLASIASADRRRSSLGSVVPCRISLRTELNLETLSFFKANFLTLWDFLEQMVFCTVFFRRYYGGREQHEKSCAVDGSDSRGHATIVSSASCTMWSMPRSC